MLAGQSVSPSTLATNSTPVHADSSSRLGRRRGLSHLYTHLLHHSPPTSTASSQSPRPDTSRPQPHRAPSSPSPSVTSSNTHQHSANAAPDSTDTDSDSRRRAPIHTPRRRMIPLVNTRPFPAAQSSHSSSDPPPAAEHPAFLGSSVPSVHAAAGRSDGGGQASTQSSLPSIQFIPATDPTRARPSLDFKRITRILPAPQSVIRVGRYSERDSIADGSNGVPSDAPIGFKSKVVSRRHCEFSFSNGQWFVKDVKSSSGTFLNHIRLSQPGVESRPYPINDGDTVQLGIDFKGGEEMIFRCVKIRVETNRGWQRGLNKFNKSTHKQLQALAKGRGDSKAGDSASKQSTDCTICLNSIAPCQALFVAPCSHTWHYRCIRTILEQSSPHFLCPNCRAQADLDAEVEDLDLEDFEAYEGEWEELGESAAESGDREARHTSQSEVDAEADAEVDVDDDEMQAADGDDAAAATAAGAALELETTAATAGESAWGLSPMSLRQNGAHLASLDDTINQIGRTSDRGTSTTGPPSSFLPPPPSFSLSSPRAIPGQNGRNGASTTVSRARTNTAQTMASELSDAPSEAPNSPGAASPGLGPNPLEGLARDGPMTPRNNAGPFVFDGGAEP